MSVGGAGRTGGTSGTTGAAAAGPSAEQEAARQAAEAARRAAEAARQAALARQAAEAQRQAAQAAERQAQALRQQVGQKGQQLAHTPDPQARQALQKEIAQLEKRVATLTQEASKGHTAAVSAEQRSQTATADSQKAQRAANDAARKAGLPAPYANVIDTRYAGSGFSGTGPTTSERAALSGGAPGVGNQNDPQQLVADAAYHRAVSEPGGRQVLDTLGVTDGKSLLTYARGLGDGASGAGQLETFKSALAPAAPQTQKMLLEKLGFLSQPLQRVAAQDPELQQVASGQGLPRTATDAEPQGFADLGEPTGGEGGSAVSAQPTTEAAQTQETTATEEPTPTAEEVAHMSREEREALSAIGLKPEDLIGTGTAAAELISAGRAALEHDWKTAAEHLTQANEAAPQLAEKALGALANVSPEPIASLLKDPATVRELVAAAPEVLQSVLAGDVPGALEQLAALPTTRDKLIELAAAQPAVAQALQALGITVDQLKQAGAALPDLMRAAQAAVGGKWEEALGHLQSAWPNLSPALQSAAEAAFLKAADKLPADHPARAFLTDPTVVRELIKASPEALSALMAGEPWDAIEQLAGSEGLRNAVIDVAAKDPAFTAALEKLGLSAQDLKDAGEALPALVRGLEAALKNPPDWDAAFSELSAVAQAGSPLAEKAILHLAQSLPEDNPARAFLTDPDVVKALVSAGPEVLQALWDKDFPKAFQLLAGNPTLQTAFFDAVLSDPNVTQALTALGLSAEDVRNAGAAAPELLAAALAAKDGQWEQAISHLQAAASNEGAQELVAKLVANAAANLPEGPARQLLSDPNLVRELLQAGGDLLALAQAGDLDTALASITQLTSNPELVEALKQNPYIKGQLEALGISEAQFDEALQALPDLLKAAEALGKQPPTAEDVEAAIRHLAAAAATAPGLGADLIGRAAERLPAEHPARALLTDETLMAEVLQNAPGVIDSLLSDNVPAALEQLAGLVANDEGLRTALASNTFIQEQLAALGITDPAQQQQAVDALPELLQAAASLSAQPPKVEEAIGHLTAAAQKAPDAIASAIAQAAKKLPADHPALPFLTDTNLMAQVLRQSPEVVDLLASKSVDEALAQLATISSNPELQAALLANPSVQQALSGLGITDPALQQEALLALPDVLQASAALASDDPEKVKQAIQHLLDATGAAPNVVANLVGKLAEKLDPTSPEYKLLTDENLMREAIEAGGPILSLLLEGKTEEALAEVAKLTTNPELLDAVVQNEWVKGQLDAIGVTPEQAKQVIAQLPQLFAAGQLAAGGDWEGALKKLAEVGANLPAELKDLITQKVTQAAAGLGDDNALKPFLSDAATVRALLDSAPGVITELAENDVLGALEVLGDNEALRGALLDVAWGDGTTAFAQGLASFGLTKDDLKSAAAGLPALLRGVREAQAGNWEAAATAFSEAVNAGSPMAAKALATWATNTLPEGSSLRAILTDQTLMTELLKSGPDVVAMLARGNLPGAMDAVTGNEALMTALKASPAVRQLLTDKLGIPEHLLDEAMNAAPELLRAAEALLADPPNWDEVLTQLRNAAGDLPHTLGFLGAKLAEKLPAGQPYDTVRQLLSDGQLITALLSDSELQENLKKVLTNSDMVGGMAGLLGNDAVAEAAWNVLGPQLSQLGLTGAQDIKNLGGALPELAAALDAIGRQDWGNALDHLGKALTQAGPEFINGVVTKAIDALPGVSEEFKAILRVGLDVLRSPEGRQALKNMFWAMTQSPPDIAVFGSSAMALGGVLTQIAQTDKAQATNILNALGGLPGKIGALFADQELNAAMVNSGALNHLFAAAEDLVNGRFDDAVMKLGDAAMALLGNPPTLDGLENFARLFRQVYETLPNAVKNKIQAAVVSAAGSLFGNIPIIGDLFDAGKDLKELINEIQAGDQFGTILAAAQLGIDAAKVTQVGKAFTAPLEMAIGLLQGIDDAMDTIDEIRDQMGNIMLLGNDPTELVEIDKKDREFIQEITATATAYGMTPDQVVAFVQAHPELRGRDAYTAKGLIQSAAAAGVPPEHFPEFIASLVTEFGDLERVAFVLETIRHHNQGGGTPEEANIMLLAMLMDSAPETIKFLEGLGINPADQLVNNIFMASYGRLPSADERAQYVAMLQEKAGDRFGDYRDAARDVQDTLDSTQEHQDYVARMEREARERMLAAA